MRNFLLTLALVIWAAACGSFATYGLNARRHPQAVTPPASTLTVISRDGSKMLFEVRPGEQWTVDAIQGNVQQQLVWNGGGR